MDGRGSEQKIQQVTPDDPFWDAKTYAGEAMDAGEIDDVVYGGSSE